MANIREIRDKEGKLTSFFVRVHRGKDMNGKELKPWSTTFHVQPTWKETTARKKAEAFAATFEKECREGTTTDTRMKFAEYCAYVIEQKEVNGTKHSTIVRYKELASRINQEIGHLKLKDLRADHLNALYMKLLKTPLKSGGKATATMALGMALKKKKLSGAAISKKSGVSTSTVSTALQGKSVSVATAQAIADAVGIKLEKAFVVEDNHTTLSPKTVLEHHRLISTVLEQAMKEGLIPFNTARRATLPKAQQKQVNYFQPNEIEAIREALEQEPLKWKTLTHLLLISGARRGEILGLKWDAVDFERSRIHIHNEVLYSVERGVYEETPKTKRSVRYIALPKQTMTLLRWWQNAQNKEKIDKEGYYQDHGFLFTRDDGNAMNPDSVNDWLKKFADRHDLPHINPHAFRHTMASMLYYNGVDSVSISSRLGHAQVSTTANIYAHVIESADQRNADILSDVMLKQNTAHA